MSTKGMIMFVGYIGYNGEIADIFNNRNSKHEIKLFAEKPTVEDIIRVFDLECPDQDTCKKDYDIFQNALKNMLHIGNGYYYGKNFYLKQIFTE